MKSNTALLSHQLSQIMIYWKVDAFKKWKGHKNKWFETKHLNLHK